MPVYDVNDALNTRAETWESVLVGALVEVTFSLRHFYMGVTPSRPEAYDVFSATVESISVLEKPAPVLRSPFQQRVAQTKPRPVPQAPLLLQPSSSPSASDSNPSSSSSSTTTAGPSTSASASSVESSGNATGPVRAGKKRDHEGGDDDSMPPATRPKRGNGKGSS